MICLAIQPDNTLLASNASVESCSGVIGLSPAEYVNFISTMTFTPEQILYVFTWGFGTVMFFWSLGATIGAVKRTVSKA